jgi:hypothetical protein
MAYFNGYVYVLCNIAGDFGRYCLASGVGNWETLSTPPIPPEAEHAVITSDRNEYIYLITLDYTHDTTAAAGRYLGRYSTISGAVAGWEDLNKNYTHNWSGGGNAADAYRLSFVYDEDRNVFYLSEGEGGGQNSIDYIQKYTPATDTWNNFLKLSDYTGLTSDNYRLELVIAYYDDYLYLANFSYADSFFRYNILTDTMEQISTDFRIYGYQNSNASILAAPVGPGGSTTIYFANIYNDRDNLYYYNPSAFNGTYTSPIFDLQNGYDASYFIVDGTATSGTGSISYDDDTYNGTIRVRSSNTEPLRIDEAFYASNNGSYINYRKYSVYDGSYSDYTLLGGNPVGNVFGMAVSRRTGRVSVSSSTYLMVADRYGNKIYDVQPGNQKYAFNVRMEFDKNDGLWGYDSTYNRYLRHVSANLSSDLAAVYDGGSDFLYDLAVEWNGDGVWYTDKLAEVLFHRDAGGALLTSIGAHSQPRAICATTDNGCWVIDNDAESAYRYGFDGGLIKTVLLNRTAIYMTYDYNDGFWYINGEYVYHVTSGGTEDAAVYIGSPYNLTGTRNGCLVNSTANNNIKYIDYTSKMVTKTLSMGYDNYYIGAFSLDIENQNEFKLDIDDFIPASYDPVWGTGGSLEWKEVRKDGYFLPKYKYHQVEVTLRGDAELEKIIMAPAIKVQDIPKGTYKNMYIRSDIPEGADIASYEGRIRAWWGVEE